MEMSKIKVLVADDHPVFLEGLCTVLTLTGPEIELVGHVQDGKEALEQARILKPDVVLLDIKMPVMGGVEAAQIIKNEMPKTKIIMLTTFDDKDLILAALKAGTNGYILKDAPVPQIIESIRSVYHGNILISPKVAEKISTTNTEQNGNELETECEAKLKEFTVREKEIIRLMVVGNENWQIARELCISEKTVRNYVSQIYDILGVHNRTQAVLWALDNGIK
jgi:DNA-binding NarL/FixJ family response regulator